MKIYSEVKGIPEEDKSKEDKTSDTKALEIKEDTTQTEETVKVAELPNEDTHTEDKPQVEDEFNATKNNELK